MSITPLPPAPSRTEPSTFSDKADAFVAALPQFVTEANAQAAAVDSAAQQTASNAISASVSAGQAAGFANEAAQQAFIAQSAANFRGVWQSSTNYSRGETIAFDGERYVALRSSQGQVPDVSDLDWLRISVVADVRTPTAIAPLSGASGVILAAVLDASPYAPLHSADARVHREFQVALGSDVGFSAPVFTSNVNANSVTVSPALTVDTAYRWRCRDVTTINGEQVFSAWMDAQAFTTANVSIATPTVTVTGGPSNVPQVPTITTSAFATSPAGADSHFATSWTVRRVSDNALVFSSLNNQVNLTSIEVPTGVLAPDTAYNFQARHIGLNLGQGPLGQVQGQTIQVFDIVPLLAVGHQTAPRLTIYDQSIDTFTKLADPAVLPASTPGGLSFNPDDSLLAVAEGGAGNTIGVYSRNQGVFTRLPALPSGAGIGGQGCAFSPDGGFLALASNGAPRVSVYTVSGQNFTRLANLPSLPSTGGAVDTSWAAGASHLAVAVSVSPFIFLWSRSGNTFTRLSNPAVLPAGEASGCAFSSDGVFLAVSHVTSPFVTVYSRSGNTFTKIADPATLPTGGGLSVAWSPNGEYLAVGHVNAPFLSIYKRNGNALTKLADPAVLPANAVNRAVWSADNTYLAVAHNGTPFITIYKRNGDTFTALPSPNVLPTGAGLAVAFSNTGFPQ